MFNKNPYNVLKNTTHESSVESINFVQHTHDGENPTLRKTKPEVKLDLELENVYQYIMTGVGDCFTTSSKTVRDGADQLITSFRKSQNMLNNMYKSVRKIMTEYPEFSNLFSKDSDPGEVIVKTFKAIIIKTQNKDRKRIKDLG